MYRYIKNPKTNKSYNITSRDGVSILRRYINQVGGNCSNCNKTGHNARSCKSQQRNIKLVIKPKHAKITQLNGPVALYLWDIKCPNNTRKKILLLSEEHLLPRIPCPKSNNNCANVDDFLIKLLTMANAKNKCIDLFIEEKQKNRSAPLYLKGGGVNKNNNLLHHTKNTFYNCAWHAGHPSTKKKCTYKNLRVHNFDLRFSNAVGSRDRREHRTSNKLDILLYNLKQASGYSHRRDYSLLANYILGYTIKSSDTARLNKLIETLSNSATNITTPSYTKRYSVAEIKSDMTNFRRIVKKEYNKYLKTKHEYIPRKNRKLRSCLKHIINQKYNKTKEFAEYTHLFTDLYILSRIFMEFTKNKAKIARSPAKCSIVKKGVKTINISPNKVIILAGDQHIDVYNQVLDYYYPNSLVYKTVGIKFDKQIKTADILPKINNFMDIIEKFIE
tara:strand:+ start:1136 stop:2470 length:1335 start_codon:yes stop_codon:yes gene_type:complete